MTWKNKNNAQIDLLNLKCSPVTRDQSYSNQQVIDASMEKPNLYLKIIQEEIKCLEFVNCILLKSRDFILKLL